MNTQHTFIPFAKRFVVILCILGLSLAFSSGAGQASAAPAQQALNAAASMTPDDGSVLDLMVVWTPAAETEAGGEAKIKSWIDGMVLRTNMAFRNSGINPRLVLAYKSKVNYTEVDQSTDLTNLFNGASGLDVVHTWRDTYHADLVLMIRSIADHGGGQAYQLWTVSTASSEGAYGVAPRNNLWSFPHELGHMLSSSHDWYTEGPDAAVYSYAYGHTSPVKDTYGTLFVDIMSYGGGASTYGGGLYKILAYANPDLTYRGQPLGVPAGTKSNCTKNVEVGLCDADLRLAFNNTTPAVAQFRSSEVRWTGAVDTDWNNAGNWEITVGNPASPTLQGIAPRAIDNVMIPSGVSRYPTIHTGDLHARDVTIQSGASLNMNGGTLTVSGNWRASGAFVAAGGIVIFNAAQDKAVLLQMNNSSSFYHLQIGDGTAMPWVQLTSNLDVNGNLTLNAGSLFQTGSYQISLAGNWQDNGAGFDYANSKVTFNGSGQTANAVSSAVVLNQDFSNYDGSSGSYTDAEPFGWAKALGTTVDVFGYWWFGDPGAGGVAQRDAFLASDSAPIDAWLFTQAVNLSAGANYRLTFDYKVGLATDASDFSAWYGSHLLPSKAQTAIVTVTGATNTTWSTANQSFNVPDSRTYNLGLRNNDNAANSYMGGGAYLDNIILTVEPVIPPDFGAEASEFIAYIPLIVKEP